MRLKLHLLSVATVLVLATASLADMGPRSIFWSAVSP
jgi:hypothetical protein